MTVIKTEKKNISVPDYYGLYVKWAKIAEDSGKNEAIMEAQRFARLAEEFGLAIIFEDITEDF